MLNPPQLTILIALLLISVNLSLSEKSIITYSFLNSLKDYEFGEGTDIEVPGPSTKVPVWMGRMASAAGNDYRINAQFGFVDGWLNQLNADGGPQIQLGYEGQGVSGIGASEGDWVSFAAASVTDISMVTGNFFQWLEPSERSGYYVDMLGLCETNAPGAKYWIYYGWPPFDAYGGDSFPNITST